MSDHHRVRQLIAAIVLAALKQSLIGQEETHPAVEVQLFNQGEFAEQIVNQAKEGVARLYQEIGVEVIWMSPSPERSRTRFLIIRLLLQREGPARVMGTTVVGTHDDGGTARIYPDRVFEVAHERGQNVARLLAYAIGHEIGHLLLPYPAISRIGVMRPDWDQDDLRHIANGSLRFTTRQGIAIRAKLSNVERFQPQ